jgi:broad specificity phosphatase PhoE
VGVLTIVRHGQASFGTDDYDRLSDLGIKQSAALGQSWEAGGTVFTHAIAGAMKRHAQTAITAIDASGLGEEDADPGLSGYDVDAGWNEYDHLAIARALDPAGESRDMKSFQVLLNQALDRWIAQKAADAPGESYVDFRDRVMAALTASLDLAGRGQSVVVFSSGGPIAMVVSHLLAGDDSLFQRLNDVVINASTTTIINGSTGPRLLAFNEHTHLPTSLVTYR